jgi:hypothetical protein
MASLDLRGYIISSSQLVILGVWKLRNVARELILPIALDTQVLKYNSVISISAFLKCLD